MVTRPFIANLPGLLLAGAVATALPVLWLHAVPITTGLALPEHRGHWAVLVIHTIGGVSMLALGAAGLFIGWTRRGFAYHRRVGRAYLALGGAGALTALALSILAPHEPKSLYVATGTLALVWLAVAAMGFRAARNRRFEAHRKWMIRSYGLSWTFVGCRLAESVSFFPQLGREGITATIWVNWVVPLLLCEFALQWRKAGRARA